MITIRLDKTIEVNGEWGAFVSFPYDNLLISIIRELPDRHWHKDEKEWEIPLDRLQSTLQQFGSQSIKIIGQVENEELVSYELPQGFEFITTPYDHQIEGFQYGLENDRFVLGDEQGLGKTKQIIDIALARRLLYGYKHCLIVVCLNGLKWNWYEECKIHGHETPWILGTRYNSKGKMKIGGNSDKLKDLENLPENYFLITNIESFRSPEIAASLKELCATDQLNMIAVDEVHKCRNPNSQQGKGLLKVQPECRVALSGTPMLERPLDLYLSLKWLGYERHSFYAFKKHYCIYGGYGGHEVVGYKNMGELHQFFNDVTLRRLKKNVLDLPPKIYNTEYVEMNRAQQLIYDEVRLDLLDQIDQISSAPNPLAQLIRLRQATGYTGILSSKIKESAKLDRTLEMIQENIESGKKTIIYSNWTKITDQISFMLKENKISHVLITGQFSSEVNHKSEKIFQENEEVMACVATIDTLGAGYTLTAATEEIFVDEPWNQKIKEQAEDRAHRIGTTESLRITTLLTKDTVDERINQIVYKKGAMADAVVDGKMVKIDSSTIQFLLS